MRSLGYRLQDKLLNIFLYFFEKIFKNNLTFHIRPKLEKNITINSSYVSNNKSELMGIVMQGPLILEDSYTLETLKLYKKLFASSRIILSTWNTEDSSTLEAIKLLEIEIILNKKPIFSGIANVNFQIASTSSGIIKANELGCTYVLKTRTDQRIHSSTALDFCYSSVKKFPLLVKNNQKERIISFNLNTFMFRPYSISDMVNFGNIEDMMKYWCIDLDTRKLDDLPEPKTLIEWSTQRLAEVYFVSCFLKNINQEFSWSLQGSWTVVSENFCILNTYDIDLHWKKYTRKEFRHDVYKFSKNKQINFSDWLIFQNNLPKEVPEDIISTYSK